MFVHLFILSSILYIVQLALFRAHVLCKHTHSQPATCRLRQRERVDWYLHVAKEGSWLPLLYQNMYIPIFSVYIIHNDVVNGTALH